MAWLTQVGFYHVHGLDSDLHTYWLWGERMLGGSVPYRDFVLEYPPGVVPVVVLPAVFGPSLESYGLWFGIEMLACGIATVVLAIATLARVGASRRGLAASVVLLVATPLLIGPLLADRFDLWPAVLLS